MVLHVDHHQRGADGVDPVVIAQPALPVQEALLDGIRHDIVVHPRTLFFALMSTTLRLDRAGKHTVYLRYVSVLYSNEPHFRSSSRTIGHQSFSSFSTKDLVSSGVMILIGIDSSAKRCLMFVVSSV
jgi:hypothetical protein